MKLPGFIDSHLHFLGLGYIKSNVELKDTESIEEVKALLKASTNKKMILSRGWNQENFIEKRMLTKNDLNQVSDEIPIIATRVCGHVIVVNDKMMEIAGISDSTKQINGGEFSYETGIFSEKAIGLIYDFIPQPSIDDIKEYLIKADQILLSNGITSCASDDFSVLPIDYKIIIKAFVELYNENKLHVKITEQVNLPIEQLKEFIELGYVNKRFDKFRMGPLKILADGSLGGKTAFLNAPYENEPNNFGIRTFIDEELFEIVHLADINGMDTVIHAIGDGAIDQAINTIARTQKITKRENHHAIIHAQLATEKQIERMAKLNIGAIIQPIFINSDIKIIESRIGTRSKHSYLFNTMFKNGLKVGFSTDAPVENCNPFENIYTSVTRKSIKFPDLEPFFQNEGYELKNALKAYTTNNLHFVYQNEISQGDYIKINKNIYEMNIEDIKNIKVMETYIDDKLVYKKKNQE